MPKDQEKQKRLGKLLWQVTKDQIGGDRQHGWGVDDSMAVIEQLAAEDLPDGATLSDECLAMVRMVVNPSAFRQQLEGDKVGLLAKSEKNAKRSSSLADIATEFGD